MNHNSSQSVSLQALRDAAVELESIIADGPIVPSVTPEEIRSHLAARYPFREAMAFDDIVRDVEQMLRKWQVHVTHPRYFGLFNPSVTPASVTGDALAAMYNPQLAAWRTSPGANEMERHVLHWLSAKFGLPETAVANFTSGGGEANFSALLAALTHAFPEFTEGGLRQLPAAPAFYLTGGAHHGYLKTARMAGLGPSAMRLVAMDADLKMDVADLARKVDEDRRAGLAPFLVVATAGTTAAGVIDPLADIARFCRSENLWFHVDAAWGGAAVLSPGLRSHLAGIEQSDSITCDAHKWFSVPMGAGMFFCRHPEVLTTVFDSEISFMPKKTAATVDPYTSTFQWSRRFIGLKLFLALAERGESGYAEMIEHQARMGNVLRDALQKAGWRIVNKTPLPLVCFTRDGLVTSKFLPALYQRQIAWMSEVRLDDGPPVLRACVTSYRTTAEDIEWVVGQMKGIPIGDGA